jgi:hypothetical protein
MYVYGILEEQEREENAKRKFADAGMKNFNTEGVSLVSVQAKPLLAKPRSLSLAELPLMLSLSRRVETQTVR